MTVLQTRKSFDKKSVFVWQPCFHTKQFYHPVWSEGLYYLCSSAKWSEWTNKKNCMVSDLYCIGGGSIINSLTIANWSLRTWNTSMCLSCLYISGSHSIMNFFTNGVSRFECRCLFQWLGEASVSQIVPHNVCRIIPVLFEQFLSIVMLHKLMRISSGLF